ncbi:MAG TPA: hypothetical protein VFW38_03075 [Solirubrobacteraceae bacterium]|nr:hypothetical protein [Solirubrobacteraceae bacterium]
MAIRHIKILGLALAAMTALTVAAVSSAWGALPEFKGTAIPDSFTSVSTVEPKLDSYITLTSTEKNILCKAAKGKGEISNATSVKKVEVEDTGCVEEGTTNKCGNKPGAASGTITTKVVVGTIGYVEKATKKVGLALKPEVAGEPFAKFDCEGEAEEVTVRGCTIGEVTPINTPSSKGTLTTAKKGTAHEQQWTKFEGGESCTLEVEAGFFKLGTGPSWGVDTEEESFTTAIELKA